MTQPQPLQQIDIGFSSGKNHIAGSIVKPATADACPAIILVHGSGPVDRDSNGAFVTLREHFASHGFAVLYYDKPGVGQSTGDWNRQTFEDRALEVMSAIHFMKTHPAIDAHHIGLCGGSQAGWIMPIVTHLTKELAFIISISGAAVATYEQEAYRIEQQLRVDNFTEQQINFALGKYERRLEMIRQGAAVEEIMAMQNEAKDEPWFPYLADTTPEELEFFIANYQFDPAPYLRQVTCPFLGIWGELDTYVPVEKSVRITRQALAEAGNPNFQLKVFPKANHGMRVAESGSPNEPRKDFVPTFWETMIDWLQRTIGQI